MKTVSLGDLTERVTRWNPSSLGEDEFSYIDLGSVSSDTKSIQKVARVRGSEAPSRARQLLQTGDVLVSTVRPNLNAVARVPERLDGTTGSTGFTVLRPSERLDAGYLFHWVQARQFVTDMVRRATGASYPAVSDQIVKESKIPLPSIEEQRRIAAILDQAGALRAKHRDVRAHLQSLGRAIFEASFSREGHSLLRFGDVADRIAVGVVVRPASHYVPEGIPALRTLNVKVGEIDRSNLVYFSPEANDGPLAKSKLRAGDIVVSRTGNAGTAAAVPADLVGANAIDLIVISPNQSRAETLYLEMLLNSDIGKRVVKGESRGQVQQHFNVGSLREAVLPVPNLDVQRQVVARLERVRRVERRVRQAISLDDQLLVSLQSRAFRGEL